MLEHVTETCRASIDRWGKVVDVEEDEEMTLDRKGGCTSETRVRGVVETLSDDIVSKGSRDTITRHEPKRLGKHAFEHDTCF